VLDAKCMKQNALKVRQGGKSGFFWILNPKKSKNPRAMFSCKWSSHPIPQC